MNDFEPIPDVSSYLEHGAGDCELRSISFSHPNMLLTFYDPYYERIFFIALLDVNFVFFYSNHMQNVVGRIYCFNDWQEAIGVESFATLINKTIPILDYLTIRKGDPIIYIEPITGGDFVAQYSSMTITDKIDHSKFT